MKTRVSPVQLWPLAPKPIHLARNEPVSWSTIHGYCTGVRRFGGWLADRRGVRPKRDNRHEKPIKGVVEQRLSTLESVSA